MLAEHCVRGEQRLREASGRYAGRTIMVLNMEVLERFRLQVATRPVSLSSKKSRALLAYLALRERHEATRENLVGLLWSNSPPSHGRASLRQAIYQIQTQMSVADGSALEAES